MNEEFSLILENSPVGYCIISGDLKLEYVNQRLLEYLEIESGKLLDKKWINLIIDKNFLQFKEKIIIRWLKIKFNSESSENKFIIKLFDNLPIEFFIQISKIQNNSSLKEISPNKRLVTIYPVSGTILLYQSRLKRKLDIEYQIAGKIQRNINNSILNSIEGRYFKYYFKRLFMPSGVLSGDIVNIKPVSRRYSSIFLGDGRGHGLPAALYSALIHSYLNMMASEVNSGQNSTAKLIEQINKNANRDFSETGELYFFSGVYGLIDGNTREFCLTNAGHPLPLFIRDGNVTRLTSNGPLVGVEKNSTYSENRFELKNGDTLLFFTDGIYDVLPGESDVDYDILTLTIKKYLDNQGNVSDVFNYLVETIDSHKSQVDVSDDITVLQMFVEEK